MRNITISTYAHRFLLTTPFPHLKRVFSRISLGKAPLRFRHNPFHGRDFHLTFALEKNEGRRTSAWQARLTLHSVCITLATWRAMAAPLAVASTVEGKLTPYIYSMGDHDALILSHTFRLESVGFFCIYSWSFAFLSVKNNDFFSFCRFFVVFLVFFHYFRMLKRKIHTLWL